MTLAPPRTACSSRPAMLLAAIVLLALTLRLIDAGAWLNQDEGYTWLVASAPHAGAFLDRLARYENTPPLYYLLLEPLPLTSELWLRLPAILAGTASTVLIYELVRGLEGVRPARLAALAWAVAPFAVSYADYARGFMLAGLGVLAALLAASRIVQRQGRAWWWLYGAAGVWALYSEYYAAIYLIAIVVALMVLSPARRRRTVFLGLLPLLAYLPWIRQIIRQANDVGVTKLRLPAAAIHLPSLRDAIVAETFGEHGAASSAAVRDLQALAVLAVAGWALRRLATHARRETAWLLGGVLLVSLAGFALATLVDTNLLRERYLTTTLALACGAVAIAVSTVRRRALVPAAAIGLVLLGLAVAATRAGRQYEPNAAGAVAFARDHGARLIYTNTPVTSFYARRFPVVLDRPFGLGRGRAASCPSLCAIIDDSRIGDARRGHSRSVAYGPLVVSLIIRGKR